MNEDSYFQEEEFGCIKDGTSFLITGATGFIGERSGKIIVFNYETKGYCASY